VIWPTEWIVDFNNIDPIKLRKYLDSIRNDYDCLENPKWHKHPDWIEQEEEIRSNRIINGE
jgi:hypothetical protein